MMPPELFCWSNRVIWEGMSIVNNFYSWIVIINFFLIGNDNNFGIIGINDVMKF